MSALLNHNMDTEAVTNTDSWWKPIDEIRSEIYDYNYRRGLKTIMSGAWRYDTLVIYAKKMGYQNAEELPVKKLLEIADTRK